MAYAALEPFGSEREDQRAASIVQVIANANRDKKQKFDPYELAEVTLDTPYQASERQRAKASGEDLLAKAAAINSAFGGRDKRKK